MAQVSMERENSKSDKGGENGKENNKYWTYYKRSQSEESVHNESFCKVGEKLLESSKMMAMEGYPNVSAMCSTRSISDNVQQNSPLSNESRSPPPYPAFDVSYTNDVFNSYNDNGQQICSQQVRQSLICECIVQVCVLYAFGWLR